MLVTAVAVAVVALTLGQGQANPKPALAIIFAIIGGYLLVTLLLQSLDLSKAEASAAASRPTAPGTITNPATLPEADLWAALATGPIGKDALAARRAVWGGARESLRTGMVVCVLIFLSVPPIYLFETFVPLLIGGPLIAAIAIWRSVAVLRSGGDLDRGYERADVAMAPLGLSVTERPKVSIEARSAAPLRVGPRVHGALVLEGMRHGRHVTVRMPTDGVRTKSEVRIDGVFAEVEFRARDGRLKAADPAPDAVRKSLKAVPNSTRWNGVRGGADGSGLRVERKGSKEGDWLLDLWLAERLAALL